MQIDLAVKKFQGTERFRMTTRGHIGVQKKWNGGHVGVPKPVLSAMNYAFFWSKKSCINARHAIFGISRAIFQLSITDFGLLKNL